MLSKQKLHKYYNALLAKDAAYKGVFFVGVKTTGVFCRPTCPALKPNFENYEFFETAELALLSSFRPCERCRPLSHPSQVPELVSKLVEAVEAHPEKLILYATWLDTPLKPMLAIGDKKVLYLLEFVDRRGLEREIERLHQKTRSAIVPGWTEPLRSIDRELAEYFKGANHPF